VSRGVRQEVGEVPFANALRGAAVIAVMLFHYAVFAPTGGDPWIAALARVPWLDAAVRNGWLGVDVFFVLSGFLLVLPWLAHDARGEPAPRALPFYERRFWRLAPAYYVHLAVLFGAVLPLIGGARLIRGDLYVVGANVVAHGLFLQDLTPLTSPSLGLNGALWTLSIEVEFYALLPLVAPLFVRRPVATTLAALAASIAWRYGAVHSLRGLVSAIQAAGAHWQWSEATVRGFLAPQLPAYLAHFACGMLLARTWLRHRAALKASAGTRPSLLARMGNISYSAYLWHVPTIIVLERFVVARGSWMLLPVYLAVVVAIAALSRRYLEPPFPGWPRGVAYGAREREPTASAVSIASD
jgi:peptidoglycan/LPS O-acetylase OafA/YrhL